MCSLMSLILIMFDSPGSYCNRFAMSKHKSLFSSNSAADFTSSRAMSPVNLAATLVMTKAFPSSSFRFCNRTVPSIPTALDSVVPMLARTLSFRADRTGTTIRPQKISAPSSKLFTMELTRPPRRVDKPRTQKSFIFAECIDYQTGTGSGHIFALQ